jgi:hypothetical protein
MGQAKQRGTFEQRQAAAILRDAEIRKREMEYADHVKGIGAELGIEIVPIRPKRGDEAGTLAIVSVPQLEALLEVVRPYLVEAKAAEAEPAACPCGPECECGANEPASEVFVGGGVPAGEPTGETIVSGGGAEVAP